MASAVQKNLPGEVAFRDDHQQCRSLHRFPIHEHRGQDHAQWLASRLWEVSSVVLGTLFHYRLRPGLYFGFSGIDCFLLMPHARKVLLLPASLADHVLAVAFVFGADGLADLVVGGELGNSLDDPWLDESVGVVNGDLNLQVA